MPKLGVNIDHVATLRQARYRGAGAGHPLAEPSPLQAALAALEAGAYSITVHLREDRRHIQEQDVLDLKKSIRAPLNLEMAVSEAMSEFAIKLKPADVCLVPENRREVTTEGGLNVRERFEAVKDTAHQLGKAGITVSLFIDPELEQVRASGKTGAPCVELHTGAYSNALDSSGKSRELQRLKEAAELAHSLGLQVNAGHGLNYNNLASFLATPHLDTLNIGHAIVSRAIFTGMNQAVRDMLALLRKQPS
ncbi:MAG: pyridoxine 5'-phosphate synthase [Methylacidiphilales bacterium]|nr:pyridoxine 5'-phosphate synthase [Candidatus Methylacidiphilales bacterium]